MREKKNKRVLGILSVGVVGCLAACMASSLVSESEPFRISSKHLVFKRSKEGIQVEMDTLRLEAMGGRKFCDVTVEEVMDTNGNGKIGDDGDQTNTVFYTQGSFTKLDRKSLTLTVPSTVTRGYLRIRGRECGTKKGTGPTPVLSVFEVTRSGFSPLSHAPGVQGDGFALLTGTRKPHFLAMGKISSGREIIFRVGDVRSSPSAMLTSLYAGGRVPAGIHKQADFLGALVSVDGLLFLLPGPGIAEIRLPYRKARIQKLRVVSFDRTFKKVGDWRLGGLAL
jgi:hypothetical protein